MHSLICGLVVAVMALFPGSAVEGGLNLKAWMESYEKYLYQQMHDNIENARRNEEICQNSAKNEVLHEQTAGKKVAEEPPCTDGRGDMVQNTVEETHDEEVEVPVQDGQDTTMAAEAEMAEGNGQTPLYSVDGYIPDEGLQTYLYQRLCEAGIGWFHPYSICLIAQESTWNSMAENRNGLDKGLLQYRISYWPTLEWWNPYAEIDVFVAQMANRAATGCTVSVMISRHMMSDYGEYNQSYVDAVMAHSNTLVQIR